MVKLDATDTASNSRAAQIIPAILVKTQEEFVERLKLVAPHVSRVQWDIMDGKFVDNVTFSDPSVLPTLDSKLSIEADLMVSDPENWVGRLRHPKVDQLIFHVEAKADAKEWPALFNKARAAGFEVGIASEPETPLDRFWDLLSGVDRFQAMGGRSGFGGQKFDPSVLKNIRKVRQSFPDLPISIDIGVNTETASKMVAAGATVLCVGSAIFESDNVEEAITKLKGVVGNA